MGFFFGLATALIWGAQPVVAAFGYRAGLTALDLTMLRFLASGLLMLPFFLCHSPAKACGIGWTRAAVLILLAGPVYNLVLVGGLHWAPASHSSLIHPACIPLFTAVLARWLLGGKERIPLAGVLLLIAGVVVVKLGTVLNPGASSSSDAWIGDLLFVAAALMWALYTVLMRRWNTAPLAVVALVQVGGLVYLPLYFSVQGLAFLRVAPSAIAMQAGFLGIVVSVLSVLLFNHAVHLMGSKASLFTALMPVVGVSLAVLLLGEPTTLSMGIGTLLIMGGLFLSLRKPG